MQESMWDKKENKSTFRVLIGENHVESNNIELQMNVDQNTSKATTNINKSISAIGNKVNIEDISQLCPNLEIRNK
jgi:hypothetical protein